MKTTILFAAVAAGVGLLGCAQVSNLLAPPPPPCNAGVCKVVVTVSDCAARGGISVNHPYLPVPKGPHKIEWEFAAGSSSYSFPPNAIFIKSDPQKDLDAPVVAPKKVTANDKHNQSNYTITYGVNVTRSDGTYCYPLDPWIEN